MTIAFVLFQWSCASICVPFLYEMRSSLISVELCDFFPAVVLWIVKMEQKQKSRTIVNVSCLPIDHCAYYTFSVCFICSLLWCWDQMGLLDQEPNWSICTTSFHSDFFSYKLPSNLVFGLGLFVSTMLKLSIDPGKWCACYFFIKIITWWYSLLDGMLHGQLRWIFKMIFFIKIFCLIVKYFILLF